MDIEKLKSIGILLLGLGIFLLGLVSFLFYLNFYLKATKYRAIEDAFYAFCTNGYIKIKAYRNLHNVEVIYNNVTVCSWEYIKRGSSKVCDVHKFIEGQTKAFVVKSREKEDIVICYSTRRIVLPT